MAWAHGEGVFKTDIRVEAVDGAHTGVLRADGTPGISLNVEAVPRVKTPLVPNAVHAAFLNTLLREMSQRLRVSRSAWGPLQTSPERARRPGEGYEPFGAVC